MTANLTPEQKEHLKIAHRANLRIEETWSLFCMYLSQDKTPEDALEKARQAVSVWADWMDQNEVEPPEIEHRDFGQQMAESMQRVFSAFPQLAPSFTAGALAHDVLAQGGKIDAEFLADPNETAGTADERTADPKGSDSPNSNTK